MGILYRTFLKAFIAINVSIIATIYTPMIRAEEYNSNTDAFKDGYYGIMSHFLKEWLDPNGSDWNSRVNDFDVESYADDVLATGASHVIFTLQQNSGYFVSPNATYDSYTGYSAGERTSYRDLPLDLYYALNARGIKLFLYLPSGAPSLDNQARSALGWSDSNTSQQFQGKWENIIREWSIRYGDKIAGWWFDGVYSPDAYRDYSAASNFNTFAAAAKAGNANAIVAFNSGFGLSKLTSAQDYTAGELNFLNAVPNTRWVDGIQWQVLSYVGYKWNDTDGRLQYSDKQVIDYILTSASVGGVVTLDVGTTLGGRIVPSHLNQLKAVKAAVRNAFSGGVIVNADHTNVTYNGNWATAGRSYGGYWTNGDNSDPTVRWVSDAATDFNQDVAYTRDNNAYTNYNFYGPSIEFISERANDLGDFDVHIDGVFQQTATAYTTGQTESRQVVYSNNNLSVDYHTIRVTKKSGEYLLIDGFRTSNTTNSTSSAFSYGGNWGYSSNRSVLDIEDDVHYSTENGSSVTFTFVGTGLDFITERDIDMGSVDIYIDDVYQQTIDCYATGGKRSQQIVYSIRQLSAGTHSFKAVKSGGTYMIVDAVKTYP